MDEWAVELLVWLAVLRCRLAGEETWALAATDEAAFTTSSIRSIRSIRISTRSITTVQTRLLAEGRLEDALRGPRTAAEAEWVALQAVYQ